MKTEMFENFEILWKFEIWGNFWIFLSFHIFWKFEL